MICLICRQAETSSELLSLHLIRGEMSLTVKGVPAIVCPNCGEGYLGEEVAAGLLQGAETIYLTGNLENICGYEELISRFCRLPHE